GSHRWLQVAKNQCRITHSNPLAITGAVLQTAAVHLALNMSDKTFDTLDFISKLKDVAQSEEYCCNNACIPCSKEASKPYISAFGRFSSLVDRSPFEIATVLGTCNGLEAHTSVPAAIFSFLRSFSLNCEFSDIQDPILRTIGFAVSLNGDTDTIASMAAAVSGAFYGNTLKDEIWKGVFEVAFVKYSLSSTVRDPTEKGVAVVEAMAAAPAPQIRTPKSRCAVCNQVVNEGEVVFAANRFW
uniref:ADP-ribosylhydrolase ARH3 n=1 Tax=Romanomermis culicivorax TaxID=13658 RepID=A0A915IG16_ROMCU